MARSLDPNVYKDAINALSKMVNQVVPIKKTTFIEDHKVAANFFSILEDLGAIEVLQSSLRGGTIYDWKYKAASNEPEAGLALKVMDAIHANNQKQHLYYASEEYKLKKAKKEQKERERAGNKPALIRAGADSVTVTNPKDKNTQPAIISQEVDHRFEEIVEISPNIPIKVDHFSFGITGSLSKADLLKKLELLMDDKTITGFKIELTY